MKEFNKQYFLKVLDKTKQYLSLGSKKALEKKDEALKKTKEFTPAATLGAVKGTTKRVVDGKAFFKADEEIKELTDQLKSRNQDFQEDYKKYQVYSQ